MFGKLKDKLKGWIKGSTEKVEETAEVVKTKEKPKKETKKKSSPKKTKAPKKETKKEKIEKQDPIEILLEKSPEEIIEIIEEEKSPKEVTEKLKELKEEELEKVDKLIEEAKETETKEPPKKYNTGKAKYEPDVEQIQEETSEEEPKPEEEKTGFFSKLKSKLSYKIGEDEFNEIFDDLEMLLLENNVALEVVEDLRKKLSKKLIEKEINKNELEQEIKTELKNALNEILIEPDNPLEFIKEKIEKPFVILFFGINGTGKTTSIAKITHFLKQSGHSVVLAAGDTFRAASIEQIQEHATKLDVPLIKHDYQSDPAAVGFDAIKYAKANHIDVVLIDTAGRMHTKTNLMSEMEKIVRVTKPDLKIFVAESIAGNDATEQAKAFHKSVQIDGSILSKADIDEKGGTIISVSHATNKPIFFLGTGQNYKDLELFNKQKFIEDLGLD